MNKKYYDFLGLDESATDEEIQARYNELKKKYAEERWQDGEAGNEAARMLGKLDEAYAEITAARKESKKADGASLLDEVATAIKNGDLIGAQMKLDECNERGGEWHYLQSVLFFRKNWMNESKKQLEIALQLEPNNEKYKDAYERINQRMNYQNQSAYENPANGGYQGQPQYAEPDQQMGGSGCAQCVDCCYTYMCVNCLFNCCCGCR